MSTEPALERKHRMRWWTLAVLTLSLVLIGMDNTILNVAIPTLQREFDASASTLQWMVDAYILVFAGLLLTMGSIGDRYGRAKTLRAGLVIFLVAALAASYSNSDVQVIAARAVMGVGGALIMPSTLSIIIDVFQGQERAKAIATWAAVGGIGIGIGPLVGGALLEHYWWGSVFLVNVPIALVALTAGVWMVPDSRDPTPRSLDIPGAVLSTGAVSVLVFAIIEAPSRGWTSPVALGGFGAAVALAAGFAYRELHVRHPLLNFDFFRRPRFSAGAGAISLAFFALLGMMFGLTQYLQFVKGYSAFEAGLRLLPIAGGIAIGSRMSERIVSRVGTKKVVAAGLVLLAGMLAAINTYNVDTPFAVIAVIAFFTSFAMGNIIAPATTAVMGAVPAKDAGVGSAMNDVSRQVGGAFGVAIMGSIVNTVYASKMADAVVGLPSRAAEAARDSVGAATLIANTVPGQAGETLADAAKGAFSDAFGIGVLFGTAIALIGAAAVIRFLPDQERPDMVVVPSRSAETPGEATPELEVSDP